MRRLRVFHVSAPYSNTGITAGEYTINLVLRKDIETLVILGIWKIHCRWSTDP